MPFLPEPFETSSGHALRPLSLMSAPCIDWCRAQFEMTRSQCDVTVERNGAKWRTTRNRLHGRSIAPGVLTTQDWRDLKTFAEAWACLLSLSLVGDAGATC